MEATQHRDIGYVSTIHDMKLLLLKFSHDQSFSSESGGGGPQSNMHLIPYIAHMALYVLNTTRSVPREDKNLKAFLDAPKEKWLEQCYVAEGPHYQTALAMLILSPNRWKSVRVILLQRLLLCAHARSISGSGHARCSTLGPEGGEHRDVKEYGTVYKPVILYFALIDQIYEQMFNNVSQDTEWSTGLSEWIRHNDEALLKSTSRVLSTFQDDLLPATSVDEIVDVCGLMQEIPSPASFLLEILSSVP
jgi:E3 ubiquitin-protein ligase UBR4